MQRITDRLLELMAGKKKALNVTMMTERQPEAEQNHFVTRAFLHSISNKAE
jgi:hypothetical protein